LNREYVVVTCPNKNCQHKLRLPKKTEVLKVSCPKCQMIFRYEYPFVIEILGAQESQTKTQKKCRVCYSRIYEDGRPTPCVHDRERTILGSMLARADLVGVARNILKEDDFDIEEHRVIYEAILELSEQGILFTRGKKPSVDSTLKKMGIPPDPVSNLLLWSEERGKKIPLSYLVTLKMGCIPGAVFDPESPVSAEDVTTYYAYQVKKKAIERNLQEYRLTFEARDGIQDYLGTIDYRIKETQAYWLVNQETEGSQVPLWHSSLRPELRPTGERINTLEALRAKYEIPHDIFWKTLASYPAAVRLLQINLYKQAKEKWPNLPEKDLLKSVFVGRALKPEPNGYGMTPDEFEEVMEKINSLEELCDYIVSRDSKEPMQQLDLSEWQANVEMLKKAGVWTDELQRHMKNSERLRRDNVKASICGIIEEEARVAIAEVETEMGKKAPSENLIKSLEDTYYGLRKKHPGRDEHWYLANTWLGRYGSTKQSIQKGPKLTQFIAYKDTHLYSILEPPKSIRGLALFLVYKELGEQQALHYASEFNLILEPVMKIKEENLFLDKYKEQNPWTWGKNQTKDDQPFSLYWLFRGLKFEQDNPEKAKKLMERAEKRWEEDEKRKRNAKE